MARGSTRSPRRTDPVDLLDPRLSPSNAGTRSSHASARGEDRHAEDEDTASTDGEMSPYAGLTAYQRDQAIVTASATLDEIQRVQGSTRTKDGKLRRAKFLGAVLGLRYEGYTPKQIAECLGVSFQQVTYALLQVRRDASLDAQITRLNDVAVPLAMDNAVRGVMNGDKEYTLRVLDGAGIFRSHQSVKGEFKQTIQSLSVVLEVPAHLIGKALPMPRPGAILGAPTIQTGLPPAQLLEGVVVERPRTVSAPVSRDTDVRD